MSSTLAFGDLYAVPSRNGVSVPKGSRDAGTKMINMGELFHYGRVGDADMARVPLNDNDGAKSLVEPGDLLFARRSLQLAGAGRCSIVVPASEARTFESSIIRVRLNQTLAVPEFYYYFFASRPGRQLMDTIVEQAVVAGIRSSDLARLAVPVPPIAEQSGIAATLGAVDDKIHSGRRAASLCLDLAEALFNQASESAPEVALGDAANLVLGGTPDRKRTDFWYDGTVPWINSGAANQSVILVASELITEAGLASSAAKLMPVGATVVAITGATLGQVALLGISTSGNQSLVGIWADDPDLTAWLHFAARRAMPELMGAATGAAQQHVNKGNLEELLVLVGHDADVHRWAAAARPLMDRAISLEREILHLEKLRDSLLPELLSGRIRVPEAAEVVEEAVA